MKNYCNDAKRSKAKKRILCTDIVSTTFDAWYGTFSLMIEHSGFVQLGAVQRRTSLAGGEAARAQSAGPRLCIGGARPSHAAAFGRRPVAHLLL